MSDALQKTFVVAVPCERAWAAFAEGAERSKWEAATFEIDPTPGGRVHWTLPGHECEGRVEEADPPRLLRHVELTGPHADSEVTVTFTEVEGGTRISITHAGFGDPDAWRRALGGSSLGWDQAIADLVCYLTTGVAAERFTAPLGGLGVALADTAAGVEVLEVDPDGFGREAGMAPGDLVLTAGGAPVFTRRELWVMLRAVGPSSPMDVEFVRAGRRLAGTGRLG